MESSFVWFLRDAIEYGIYEYATKYGINGDAIEYGIIWLISIEYGINGVAVVDSLLA